MAERDGQLVFRNHLTLMAAQLNGLCTGLQIAAQTNQPIGDCTHKLIENLLKDCREMWSGRVVEHLPSLNGGESLGDYVVLAESLRGVAFSFLQPDDFEELRRTMPFGLSPKK